MADEDLIAWEMLYGDGDEPSEEWQPPDHWLKVPEPDDYEINLLVNIYSTAASNSGITIHISRPADMYTGFGPVSADWGDGTVDSYDGSENGQSWSYLQHSYTDTGQYVIKIKASDQSCFLQRIQENATILIAKLGGKIIVNNSKKSTQESLCNHRALCWIKFNGTGGLPEKGFGNDPALKRIDMAVPPEIIPRSAFYNTNYGGKFDFSEVSALEEYALQGSDFKKIELPKCVSIGESACSPVVTLEEIAAPLCTSVGNNGFNNCSKLSRAEFAEDCTFGATCFTGCWSLYPRPDGSTN